MVRSGKKTARFDICPLVSIGIFDKIESLNTSSKMIIAKLKSMKMSFKSQDDLSEFKKINSLDLGNEKIKKYKEEGLKHFKIDFDRYCS